MRALTFTTAECLLDLTATAKVLIREFKRVFEAVEASRALSQVVKAEIEEQQRAERQAFTAEIDDSIVNTAIAWVCIMEVAHGCLIEISVARNMSLTPHRSTISDSRLTSNRLMRCLWDITMPTDSQDILKELVSALGVELQVWEDIPEPYAPGRRDYTRLAADFTGTVMFSHCFGATFRRYKDGCVAGINGWSASLDCFDSAIAAAKEGAWEEATKMLSA